MTSPQAPSPDEVAEAIRKLPPDKAEHFLRELERAVAKSRVQLWGYVLGLVVWLGSMVLALAFYGGRQAGEFRGWALLLPFGALALVLWLAGQLADRVGPKGKRRDRG